MSGDRYFKFDICEVHDRECDYLVEGSDGIDYYDCPDCVMENAQEMAKNYSPDAFDSKYWTKKKGKDGEG